MQTPVLLLLFNRPDYSAVLLDRMATVPVPRVYVAIDGPRASHPDDVQQIAMVKELVEKTHFQTKEIYTLYQPQNLGCRHGVKAALDWFFSKEERGIVLEDDCIPDISFFPFCDILLEKYAQDERVFAISGDNFLLDEVKIPESYYFSKYFHSWGWASWRRSWEKYDFEMKTFPDFIGKNRIDHYPCSEVEKLHWIAFYKDMRQRLDSINSWAYPFCYSLLKEQAVCIVPAKNLVHNIGFDGSATHTKNTPYWYHYLRTEPLTITSHPREVAVNQKADQADFDCTIRRMYSPPYLKRVQLKVRQLLERLKK